MNAEACTFFNLKGHDWVAWTQLVFIGLSFSLVPSCDDKRLILWAKNSLTEGSSLNAHRLILNLVVQGKVDKLLAALVVILE